MADDAAELFVFRLLFQFRQCLENRLPFANALPELQEECDTVTSLFWIGSVGSQRICNHGNHPFFQLRARIVEAAFDCPGRDIKELSDLLDAVAVNVEEGRGKAVRLGQGPDGRKNGIAHLGLLQLLRWRGHVGRRRLRRAQRHRARFLAPQKVHTAVACDLIEPAGELIGVAQLLELPPGADEGLLSHILGVVEITQQRVGRPVDGILEPLDQLAEGPQVAAPGPFDKLLQDRPPACRVIGRRASSQSIPPPPQPPRLFHKA